MHAHRHRFDERRHLDGELGRTSVWLIGGHTHKVSKRAVCAGPCDAAALKINTAVMHALLAIPAGSTVERGLDHHLLADLPVRDPRPHRRNRTAELMAHDKSGRPRMGPIAKAVHITPTNTRPLDFDEHVARLRYRLSHARHTHVTRPVKHGCLHDTLLSSRMRSVMARPVGADPARLYHGCVTGLTQRLPHVWPVYHTSRSIENIQRVAQWRSRTFSGFVVGLHAWRCRSIGVEEARLLSRDCLGSGAERISSSGGLGPLYAQLRQVECSRVRSCHTS